MLLDAINEKSGIAYYHLNCRHIHDNECDIKLDEVQRSQNIFCASWHMKTHQLDAIRWDFMCNYMQSIKRLVLRIIT